MKNLFFTKQQTNLIFLSGIGGMLEFYDFIIYALLAGYIAHNFFPTGNHVTSLIATMATFSVGYLMRPIGGLVFGHYGDKLGRKKIFLITLFSMALCTFSIGLVPSYTTLGISAPIVLVLLRMIQGFSIGGAIPGAITYISEAVPKKHGFGCGLIFFSLINGIVLGSIVQVTLNAVLTQDQIMSWGWRIPFFMGGLFGVFSYIMRKQFHESPVFSEISDNVAKFPLAEVVKTNFRAFICVVFLVAWGAALITSLFLFTPSYLTTLLHYSPSSFAKINTISLFLSTLLLVFVGFISDHCNKKILLLVVSLLSLILVYPIFNMFVLGSYSLWVPMLLSALLLGSVWGLVPPTLAEIFPAQVRYSGIAFAYNLGFAIFGGLTPLIAITLIHFTSIMQSPGYYLMIMSFLGIICILLLPKKSLL